MGLLNRHRLWQVAVDAALLAIAWYAAFDLRFDFDRAPGWGSYWQQTIAIAVGIKIVLLLAFGVYNKWWRYVGMRDLAALGKAAMVATGVLFLLLSFINFPRGATITPQPNKIQLGIQQDPAATAKQKEAVAKDLAPRQARPRDIAPSVIAIDFALTILLLGGVRVLVRSLMERPRRTSLVTKGKDVLIVGAGDAGNLVLREMLSNRVSGYNPIGLVDDDPNKRNYRFQGVKVLGSTAELPEILRSRRPSEVHMALPSAGGQARAARSARSSAASLHSSRSRSSCSSSRASRACSRSSKS